MINGSLSTEMKTGSNRSSTMLIKENLTVSLMLPNTHLLRPLNGSRNGVARGTMALEPRFLGTSSSLLNLFLTLRSIWHITQYRILCKGISTAPNQGDSALRQRTYPMIVGITSS